MTVLRYILSRSQRKSELKIKKAGKQERGKKESNKDRQAVTLKGVSRVAARRTRGPDIPQVIASYIWPVQGLET
jgi:hypothetical protein